jgi:hypothetical protein
MLAAASAAQMMPAHLRKAGAAGEVVDEADEIGPHDRPPSLITEEMLNPYSFGRFSRPGENDVVTALTDFVG